MRVEKEYYWLVASLLLVLSFCSHVFAASSLLIWPIDPVLEDKQTATALWVENRDKKSIYVQIRVLRWQQQAGEDQYSEQKEVIVSPPMAEIKAGQKQLIRLIKNTQLAANEERAFRVLIDEIPRANEEVDAKQEGFGLKFQMRYSVPLFVQGANIWTKQDYQHPRDLDKATKPVLHYKIESKNKERWLVVKNSGQVHAHLSKVAFVRGKQPTWLSQGLLGYVLAGCEMKFIMPNGQDTGRLEARVNNSSDPVIITPY